jgi:hypothetical protein
MKKLRIVELLGGVEPIDFVIHRHVYVSIERRNVAGLCYLPLYWRLLDPDFSMVEIGIDKESGKFISLAMPLYNGELSELTDSYTDHNDINIYAPKFSLDVWSAKNDFLDSNGEYYSYPGKCQLELTERNLRIRLFHEMVNSSVMISNNIMFELNKDNELISIVILGISSNDESVIRESLSAKQPCLSRKDFKK